MPYHSVETFRLLSLLVLTLLLAEAVMQFKPPGEKQRIVAIGPIDDLPKALRRGGWPLRPGGLICCGA
jgi:hypothetical protein